MESIDGNREKTSIILSSDYIGPSISQAEDIAKLEEVEVKNILRLGRILGGHILWVRNVNVYRRKGEKRWITLVYEFNDKNKKSKFYNCSLKNNEIEEFKKSKEAEDKLIGGKWKEQLITINNQRGGEWKLKNRINNMFYAFDNSREWLGEFIDFNRFCEFLKLKGNFVSEDCEINKLTSIFPIENYEEYIKNNIRAIYKRNALLIEG